MVVADAIGNGFFPVSAARKVSIMNVLGYNTHSANHPKLIALALARPLQVALGPTPLHALWILAPGPYTITLALWTIHTRSTIIASIIKVPHYSNSDSCKSPCMVTVRLTALWILSHPQSIIAGYAIPCSDSEGVWPYTHAVWCIWLATAD